VTLPASLRSAGAPPAPDPLALPRELRGILCIGDPHLALRAPGHRRDDYPRAALEKLSWCLDHARREGLVPALLGDLFHLPRDNGNALVVELLSRLPPADGDAPLLAIVGNHDVAESRLEPGDTLAILVAAGRLRLVGRGGAPWRGRIAGREVAVGGADWGEPLPARVDRAALGFGADGLVVWLTHHDVKLKGYEAQGKLEPRAIEGVDVVVNGHIHRPLEGATAGATTWLNPGNITRVKRGDGSRRAPAALRIDVAPLEAGAGAPAWTARAVEVPHAAYDEVFFPEEPAPQASAPAGSAFVANLAALGRRTTDGQGLLDFLEQNLGRYPSAVATEVRRLAQEVLHGQG
jgi:predicted phosphodiesterase